MKSPPNISTPALGAERREWDRLPISIPFFVRGKKVTGEEFLEFATALNLSAGGVLLASKQYLEPNTRISLEMPIALAHRAQLPHSVSVLNAIVLRCIPSPRCFLLGLRFDKPLIAASSELENNLSADNSCENQRP
jgi:hypothetical protein